MTYFYENLCCISSKFMASFEALPGDFVNTEQSSNDSTLLPHPQAVHFKLQGSLKTFICYLYFLLALQ